jgi:general secretion pathway protein E
MQRDAGTPIDRKDYPSDPIILNGLSAKFMRYNLLLPLEKQEGRLTVAMARPDDFNTIEAVRMATGLEVEAMLGREDDILETIQRLYGDGTSFMERIVSEIGGEEGTGADSGEENVELLRDMASEAPVIRLVNLIISKAINMRASDIHLEPFENRFRIRYRIDGVLHDQEAPPRRLQAAVISRIKIMAKMDIAERRLPQDGRIKLMVDGKEVDFRISTIPTLFGESVVMRILDRTSVILDLEQLGYPQRIRQTYEHLIQKPYGMILVTGPTGSGKTTTLYASLERINTPDKKIITVEDPVEYQLQGVNQIQVKPQIGLTFASGLRSIVRQDPDVILIGEIRDMETAEIAVQSALTGHLVFSTLHTNDAAGAVTRLLEMGVEDYLLSSCLLAIMAQRLVRVLCPLCKKETTVDSSLLRELDMDPGQGGLVKVFEPRGCEACDHTGFKGRTGIYELLPVTPQISHLILSRATASQIKKAAMEEGMKTLRQDGLDKVRQGITSISELIRVTFEE